MDKREDRWKAAREIIAHEDNLTTHRLTWFLTLQGFLFTAFAFGISALTRGENKEYHPVIQAGLILIGSAGAISPFLVVPMIKSAIRQRRAAGLWWRKCGRLPDAAWAALDERLKFPPVKGPESNEFDYATDHDIKEEEIWARPALGSYYLPHVLGLVWVLLIGCLIVSLVIHAMPPADRSSNAAVRQDRAVAPLQFEPRARHAESGEGTPRDRPRERRFTAILCTETTWRSC